MNSSHVKAPLNGLVDPRRAQAGPNESGKILLTVITTLPSCLIHSHLSLLDYRSNLVSTPWAKNQGISRALRIFKNLSQTSELVRKAPAQDTTGNLYELMWGVPLAKSDLFTHLLSIPVVPPIEYC
jgi:hypothetical protein